MEIERESAWTVVGVLQVAGPACLRTVRLVGVGGVVAGIIVEAERLHRAQGQV